MVCPQYSSQYSRIRAWPVLPLYDRWDCGANEPPVRYAREQLHAPRLFLTFLASLILNITKVEIALSEFLAPEEQVAEFNQALLLDQ